MVVFLPFFFLASVFLSYNMSASLNKVFRFANRVLIACFANSRRTIVFTLQLV